MKMESNNQMPRVAAAVDVQRRRSVTFDNGTEFTNCHRLRKRPGVELYVADPGRPQQRGTNENTNGLIRQFYPRYTRFRSVTHQHVRKVQVLQHTDGNLTQAAKRLGITRTTLRARLEALGMSVERSATFEQKPTG